MKSAPLLLASVALWIVVIAGGSALLASHGAASTGAALPSAMPAGTVSPSPPASPSGIAAVQGIIQKANAEQQQAFASNDTTVMQDTATAAYYAELVRMDAALRSGGVTAIQLVSLTFDQTVVQGSTAQVTTTETWQATYTDGTTTTDTSVNNYALVLSGGSWKISSDTQPSATIPPGATPGTMPTTVGATSRNWSGYVASGGTFTSVSGRWTVPVVTATGTNMDATWVGIGGATSTDLIQAGTQAVVDKGTVGYSAWIETLPKPSQTVPLTVAAGDTITVSLTQASAGLWNITMDNVTSGGSYTATVAYNSSASSAEWIEEAPSIGRGVVMLDRFGTVQFTNASALMNGQTVTPKVAGATAVTMVNRTTGVTLATPSALGPDGASFLV